MSSVPCGKKYEIRVTAKGKNGETLVTLTKGGLEILAAHLPKVANAQVTLKYLSKSRNEDVASTADVSDNTDTAFTAVIPASDTKMDAENTRLVVTTSEGTTEVPVEFVG